MIQIAWTAMQTTNSFPQTNTPVVCRYHANLIFMTAGTHHHPRSLNLFLVFLSVNMGVFFSSSSFGVNWRIGVFFYAWRLRVISVFSTTFILSFDFLPALLG